MAKQTVPMMKSGGNVLPKLIGWAVTVLIAVLAVQHPVEAGQVVTSLLSVLQSFLAASSH